VDNCFKSVYGKLHFKCPLTLLQADDTFIYSKFVIATLANDLH